MLNKGLGRGLDALMGSGVQAVRADDIYKNIPTEKLTPCASQPRKYFNESQLKELASSIQEKGIVQPLVARPTNAGTYEIVAGERRWRAAKMLGLTSVPVVVRNYSDSEAMTIALIENIQRENLNPIEEAEAFALLKERYKLSQEELAKNLGKSRSGLANSLRLLNLPQAMRDFVFTGKLSAAHGRTLLALHDESLQSALAERIISFNLSVRDAENLVEYANAYQRLPEVTNQISGMSAQNISIHEQNLIEAEANKEKAENTKPARRIIARPKLFVDLQKELRKHIHRGTKLSGSLENGKIVLPFSGQDELEHILRLLSFENINSIEAPSTDENPTTEKNS